MLINIKKSGKWALNGVKIVSVCKGSQEVAEALAKELIGAGWASLTQDDEPQLVVESKYDVEEIKKLSRGWWSVKFDGFDSVKVRGADNKEEAVTLAIAKVEVA